MTFVNSSTGMFDSRVCDVSLQCRMSTHRHYLVSSVTVCKLRRMWHQIRWPLTFPPSVDAPSVESYVMKTGARPGMHIEACVFQNSKRGMSSQSSSYFQGDLMCFVLAAGPSVVGNGARASASDLTLIADGANPESLNVMACAEAILNPNTTYFIVPWVFNVRAPGIARNHKSTMVLYANAAVRPAKVSLPVTSVVFALKTYLRKHGKRDNAAKKWPDIDVFALNGCICVENRSRASSVSFKFTMKEVAGMVSSRHNSSAWIESKNIVVRSAETLDVIPPRSFQIVSWWSPWQGNWSYKSSWSMRSGAPSAIGNTHRPPLALSSGGLHSVYSLD